jgi:hypothetical protein
MAKQGTKIRLSSTGQRVTVRKEGGSNGSKVKFGSVTVRGTKPAAAAVKANVERSTKALERISKTLTKPGVMLRAKKDVPQFSVAEGESGVFIRRLNGSTDRGRLVNGSFRVID